MAEHGNELLAQLGHGPFLLQGLLGFLGVFLAFYLDRQQACEGLHHRLDGTAFERCRLGSNAQIVPKKLPSVRNTGTEI